MGGTGLAGEATRLRYDIPSWIEGLALSVGKDSFGSHLIKALSDAVDAQDCAAFQYGSGGVQTLALGSVRNVDNTRLAARRYENEFWKRDRFLFAHRVQTRTAAPAMYNITVEEIGDKQFRRDCYDFQDVAEQMSVRLRAPSGLFSLSAFWGHRRRRANELEFERLAGVATSLMAFVVRHAEISRSSCPRMAKPVSLADAELLIRQLDGGLSEREIAVCTRVLRGMTMQGVAIDLGLSVHSVVTYKRRAFHRLHIATTVELFSLCMPAPAILRRN